VSDGAHHSMPHHVLLSIFVVIWGSNYVLAEVALREMAPISFSVARFLAGGGALVALLYARCFVYSRRGGGGVRLFPHVRRSDWPRLLVLSVLGATLAPWLGIEGLNLTHGARASLWLALGPAVSSGFGYALRTERIGRIGYVGIALAALGTLALAIDGLRPGRGYWMGDILLVLALSLAIVELHLIKPLAARYGSTAVVAARTAIGGALYLLIATPALAGESWLTLGMWTWVAILAGGSVGVGLGQWAKVRSLRSLGPTRVVLYGNLVPLAALALAWLAIGTQPSLLELVAGVFIVVGAVCLQFLDLSARKRRRRDAESEVLETVAETAEGRPG
jgi:drug/metabolite transporter (DMT)-like permease